MSQITSNEFVGKNISQVFPNTKFQKDLIFQKHDVFIEKNTIICLAVPNSVAIEKVPFFLERNFFVLDFSGAFRLHSLKQFETFYQLHHTHFDYVQKAVFGLPEMFTEEIKKAKFISNPGCYATSVILPIYLLGHHRKKLKPIVIADCKSGVSGAGGRVEKDIFGFNAIYENFKAYKILSHQHEPEIAQYCFAKEKKNLPKVLFTPHLLPIQRGILSTIVLETEKIENDDFIEILRENAKKFAFCKNL